MKTDRGELGALDGGLAVELDVRIEHGRVRLQLDDETLASLLVASIVLPSQLELEAPTKSFREHLYSWLVSHVPGGMPCGQYLRVRAPRCALSRSTSRTTETTIGPTHTISLCKRPRSVSRSFAVSGARPSVERVQRL